MGTGTGSEVCSGSEGQTQEQILGYSDAHHDLLTSSPPLPLCSPPPQTKMAQTDWLSPWRPPPLMLMLLLLVLSFCFLSESASTTPFPKDLEPINTVGSEQSYQYPGFQGLLQDNDTLRLGLDFQRMLRINHMLYIAARDHVFAVNLTTASEEFVPQLAGVRHIGAVEEGRLVYNSSSGSCLA
ncbi:semaphorin-6D-like protein [Lates japonicus]|uniref:Semaphorin-6D-like protein n=1 Tax=Lates japonicus TaxID=270547 RepID=A0AAD3NJA6_LATJO|nr:semaphorin-6D-like protein [Lates japonicus]